MTTLLHQSKSKITKRIDYEVMLMKNYCRLKKIKYSDIADKCGIPANNVSRFMNRKSPEMSMITFLLIAESIDYEFALRRVEK